MTLHDCNRLPPPAIGCNRPFPSLSASSNAEKTEKRRRGDLATMALDPTDAALTEKIIGAAIEVHREFGCGLKEEAYEAALCWELAQRGLKFERQAPCPVIYKGMVLSDFDEHPKRIDILVENRIVVELKAVSRNDPVFAAQCLTYLKMRHLRTGLVLNFGFPVLKDGITHVVNPSALPRPSH